MIRYCPDCAESYDPRYSSHDCGDDLYRLVTHEASVPERNVLAETHDDVGDREYADVLTTLDCRDHLVRVLRSEGYQPDVDHVTGLRVRIRVYRDARDL